MKNKLIIILFTFSLTNLFAESITVPSKEAPTIAIAVSLANEGDTICIEPGIYKERDITIDVKRLTLMGTDPNDETRIDCESLGRAFNVSAAAEKVTFKDLTFSNGNIRDQPGGALRVIGANLEIEDCFFHNCKTETSQPSLFIGGGAIYSDSTLTIARSAFIGCSATHRDINGFVYGGALYALNSGGRVEITGTSFSANKCSTTNENNPSTPSGGALYISYSGSTVTLADNTFVGNSICSTHTNPNGSVITMESEGVLATSILTFESNRVKHNSGAFNGSVYIDANVDVVQATIENNFFIYNAASLQGTKHGGIHFYFEFAGIGSSIDFNNNTCIRNNGVGAYFDAKFSPTINNSIFYGNHSPHLFEQGDRNLDWSSQTPSLTIRHSILTDVSFAGNNNIFENPQLQLLGQPRLNSPAIDAGDDAMAPELDINGNPRFDEPNHPNVAGISDIGCFEWVPIP